jgi:hypothetical protein
MQDCLRKSSTQQKDCFHQQGGIKFMKEASKMLNLEQNFVWR